MGVLVKPVADQDFYVDFSRVVDGPTEWGSRDELMTWSDIPAERFERADAAGSSSKLSPPEYGWQEEVLMIRGEGIHDPTAQGASWGQVRRADLRELCESATLGVLCPRPGLVTWD